MDGIVCAYSNFVLMYLYVFSTFAPSELDS